MAIERLTGSLRQRHTAVALLSYAVAANGVLVIAGVLHDQLGFRFRAELGSIIFSIPLVLGLTLVYLSTLLRRRKRTAWGVTLLAYGFVLCLNLLRLASLVHQGQGDTFTLYRVAWDVILPGLVVAGLALLQDEFTVKSDIRGFGVSLRFSLTAMLIAFVYGVAGFMLMDQHDFHSEISLLGAIHRTIDQFGLTTDTGLIAHTRRAQIFVNSLSVISFASVGYAFLSFFQPLRAHFSDQSANRRLAHTLLQKYGGNSEDFFKLWPHDKFYFFNEAKTAGVAYAVRHGIALTVGDPFGNPRAFSRLLTSFDAFCRLNDWRVALIHVTPQYADLYRRHGFALQQIGEEAVVHLDHFRTHVYHKKYFRQIRNRFDKHGYTIEVLQPPHNAAIVSRLRSISDDWLEQPGRSERGFMMGWFSPHYMQQCQIVVLRDQAGTIQAFVNQVPSYDPAEANFDFLRHTKEALGNSNDRLLMALIDLLPDRQRLNLGLCPLSGLNDEDAERGVIGSALRFLYANGDRFYSFSGLRRFKAKYEPEWQDRYIAYRGGVRGFTKVLNALNRALTHKTKHRRA